MNRRNVLSAAVGGLLAAVGLKRAEATSDNLLASKSPQTAFKSREETDKEASTEAGWRKLGKPVFVDTIIVSEVAARHVYVAKKLGSEEWESIIVDELLPGVSGLAMSGELRGLNRNVVECNRSVLVGTGYGRIAPVHGTSFWSMFADQEDKSRFVVAYWWAPKGAPLFVRLPESPIPEEYRR